MMPKAGGVFGETKRWGMVVSLPSPLSPPEFIAATMFYHKRKAGIGMEWAGQILGRTEAIEALPSVGVKEELSCVLFRTI